MTNFQRTADWLMACGKAPNAENFSVQVGCHLEEFVELLHCLEFRGTMVPPDVASAAVAVMTELAEGLKSGKSECRIAPGKDEEALDALCDAEVTGNGVAYMAGFDKDGADQAVLASNDAKLVDGKPVLKPGGKIGKPPGWKAPDLSAFV